MPEKISVISGWDASLSQVTSPFFCRVLIYTPGWREAIMVKRLAQDTSPWWFVSSKVKFVVDKLIKRSTETCLYTQLAWTICVSLIQYQQKKNPGYQDMKEDTVWSMDRFNDHVNTLAKDKGLPKDWAHNQFTVNAIVHQLVYLCPLLRPQ